MSNQKNKAGNNAVENVNNNQKTSWQEKVKPRIEKYSKPQPTKQLTIRKTK